VRERMRAGGEKRVGMRLWVVIHESFEIYSILGTDRVGMGLWVVNSYRFIYIYYLIKYCQVGGYPPDQNFKNRYPSVPDI
jgi:hypothetical protein